MKKKLTQILYEVDPRYLKHRQEWVAISPCRSLIYIGYLRGNLRILDFYKI